MIELEECDPPSTPIDLTELVCNHCFLLSYWVNSFFQSQEVLSKLGNAINGSKEDITLPNHLQWLLDDIKSFLEWKNQKEEEYEKEYGKECEEITTSDNFIKMQNTDQDNISQFYCRNDFYMAKSSMDFHQKLTDYDLIKLKKKDIEDIRESIFLFFKIGDLIINGKKVNITTSDLIILKLPGMFII